jgi:hypothetical protein
MPATGRYGTASAGSTQPAIRSTSKPGGQHVSSPTGPSPVSCRRTAARAWIRSIEQQKLLQAGDLDEAVAGISPAATFRHRLHRSPGARVGFPTHPRLRDGYEGALRESLRPQWVIDSPRLRTTAAGRAALRDRRAERVSSRPPVPAEPVRIRRAR